MGHGGWLHDGMLLLSLLLSVYSIFRYRSEPEGEAREGWLFAIIAWLSAALLEWIH